MKFSVLGTGRMAGKMADTTIAYMDDVKAYAAASRSPEKARDFAAAHGFEKAYGSYEELLADPDLWKAPEKAMATRAVSGEILQILKEKVPGLVGGSADLAPSNKTNMKGVGDFSKTNYAGRNLHFGVREFAMSAIANGLALHGGLHPYIASFFVFSDYTKPMARLAAIMELPVTYVMTHDSIGVGEDGPTHEPVEQLVMLRSIPGMQVFRPADWSETAAGWYHAITSKNSPVTLVLTRQNLPQLVGSSREALKGGYILQDSEKETPDAILIATGSEVSVAVGAAELLRGKGIDVRVVSMPCVELFEEQSAEYKEKVLPAAVRKRVAVEAGSSYSWGKYVGLDGATVTIDTFGASAPAGVLFKNFGFTPEHVAEVTESIL